MANKMLFKSNRGRQVPAADAVNEAGEDKRVSRGGSWSIYSADLFRSAARGRIAPKGRYGDVGFRPISHDSR